ncbi:MAG: tetratricopeptide repeat protein [Planctomycetota bacterium]|jgi:tetratricopeptide (TPR) repeat protein
MARSVCTGVLIVLLSVLVGCQGVDRGKGQLLPHDTRQSLGPGSVVNIADTSEADIVEQMAVNRQAYKQGLDLLVGYYMRTGNNMKLEWARKELAALNTMPKYNYIIEAAEAPQNLKPTASIPDADELYYDALEIDKKAGTLPVLKNQNQLRLALEKYRELIRKYPSSDKIDDAAYRAGVIHEYFKDYSIALLYFKRTFQWDPETPHPARFRAARILDQRLHRNAEALQLYQQAVKIEGQFEKYREWREFAERRIRELQKIGASGN